MQKDTFLGENHTFPVNKVRPPSSSPEGERVTIRMASLHASHSTLHFLSLPLGGVGGGLESVGGF